MAGSQEASSPSCFPRRPRAVTKKSGTGAQEGGGTLWCHDAVLLVHQVVPGLGDWVSGVWGVWGGGLGKFWGGCCGVGWGVVGCSPLQMGPGEICWLGGGFRPKVPRCLANWRSQRDFGHTKEQSRCNSARICVT